MIAALWNGFITHPNKLITKGEEFESKKKLPWETNR
jgi:hypothetical protein